MQASGAEVIPFRDHHGIENAAYIWEASTTPIGVIQLVHGLGEYVGRYLEAIKRFQDAGFHVVAEDHRGHGLTGLVQYAGDYSMLGMVGPGGVRETARNVWHATSIGRAKFPKLPIVLFGHSWGSQLAQRLLNLHGHDYAAAMFTGTAYFMPGRFHTGNFNRAWQEVDTTGFAWLSRDPAVARDFALDPLTTAAQPAQLFGLVDGMRSFVRPTRFVPSELPIHIAQGTQDAVGSLDSVARLARAFREVGCRDVTLAMYDGARHELTNELNAQAVLSDLIAWATSRLERNQVHRPARRR